MGWFLSVKEELSHQDNKGLGTGPFLWINLWNSGQPESFQEQHHSPIPLDEDFGVWAEPTAPNSQLQRLPMQGYFGVPELPTRERKHSWFEIPLQIPVSFQYF